MKINVWLMVLMLSLMGCADSRSSTQDSAQQPMVDMYKRGDGRETIQCRGIEPRNICGSSGYGSEVVFSDCSNEQFKCLISVADVFAVPRTGLTLGQEYSVFGANLVVERCFGNKGTCEFAKISSKCADAQVCNCRSASFGRSTTFYYSRDAGVTAFYTIRDDLSAIGVDAKMLADGLPLITYVLVADKGLLNAALSLPQAPLKTNCGK